MLKRTLAVLMLTGLLAVGVLGSVASATEADVEFREYEEIVENASDVGQTYLPEEYDIPGFFDYLVIPLVGLGVVVVVGVLGYYLIAQPRFQREAEERSTR